MNAALALDHTIAPSETFRGRCFRARCEARALLYHTGEFDLHEAVDALQADAVASGLVAEVGQDTVQAIMTAVFRAARR
jgi:hypothetical protein